MSGDRQIRETPVPGVSGAGAKPWPRYWLLRFVKGARLNMRVGGGWKASVRVAWMDARRYR